MLLTVNSTAEILGQFTVQRPEWGPTEMAAHLDISKSKAHSLLASLAEVGILRRTLRGRYRLGFRILEFNRVLADSTDFQCVARPVMHALSGHFGETTHLAVLDAGRVIYVDRCHGTKSVGITVSAIGASVRAHCCGVGKMLLSQLPEPELDMIIAAHGLEARTKSSITDPELLKMELAHIRRREISFDREETVLDISCVAAPIRGPEGHVVAALSIAAPTDRFNRGEHAYESAVRRACEHISRQLREMARGFEPVLI